MNTDIDDLIDDMNTDTQIVKSDNKESSTLTVVGSSASLTEALEIPTPQEDLGSLAFDNLKAAIKNGTDKQAIDDAIQSAAMAGAVNPNDESNQEFLDNLKKSKQRIIKTSSKADEYKQTAKKTEAKQLRNEAFYKAFRPILEFDLSNITERERKNVKNYNDRSYGLTMMCVMLSFYIWFYIIVAIILMVGKSINEVCNYVATFGKTAMRTCVWGFLICIILLVLYGIICWVEQKFGIPIIH